MSTEREVGHPATVGEPIVRTGEDDALGSTSWISQPRISADGGSVGGLTVRAASICGRRHARHGASREDAFAIGRSADGAVACLDRRAPIDVPALCELLGAQMIAGGGRFIAADFDEQSLSTTLTVAWLAPDGRYTGFTIGDGEAFELAAAGFTPVADAQGGSFAETGALPHAYSEIDQFSGALAAGSALLLATDGLAVPLRAPEVSAHLARRWQQPPSVIEFLDDMSFERRGESDDRTGVCVWHLPVAPGA
jgi:hypothetical protein